jgi:sugar phosphate isomerase/epimerase
MNRVGGSLLQSLAHRKGAFPFRVGATSYTIPADILSNVTLLAGLVDDVELVIFESDAIASLPDPSVIDTLRAIAARHRLTYTVHLPLDIYLGHSDDAARCDAVARCLRVISRTAPLAPFACILHCQCDNWPQPLPSSEIRRWRVAVDRSLAAIAGSGIDPSRVCVETLSYPFELVADLVARHGLSVCLDVGHILRARFSFPVYLDRYFARTRVIHLHGVRDGQDHRDISCLDPGQRDLLIARLRSAGNAAPLVTIEVFNETDLANSLRVLKEAVS